MEVDILLATYNGERYLEEQLTSLKNQKGVTINLIVRDDNSSDASLSILYRFEKYFNSLLIIPSYGENIGSAFSFYELLKYSESDFVFFCDQDDKWDKYKCLKQVNALKKINSHLIAGTFSNLKLVDGNMNDLHESLLESQRMKPSNILKYREGIFAQNPVAGCALCINSNARKRILDLQAIPKGIVHDHWFSCIISLYGSLHFLDEELVQYRQHDNNQIGNKKVNFKYFAKKIKNLKKTLMHDMSLVRFARHEKNFNIYRFLYLKLSLNIERFFS
jgi:glycosyltransferase involved in cell wall biosynthesis